jgi:hypothetical protein
MLAAKIRHNWPEARSPEYFIVTDTELHYWDEATLGPRPTIAEIEAIELPPPSIRKLAPFDFQARFTDAELVAIQTSVDPLIIRGRTMLQTITTFVDLDDQQTQQLIGYMAMAGLIAGERVQEILA